MTTMKNLWSKDLLKEEDTVLPITILQQQANYLNEMTKNIVVASIDTQRITISSSFNIDETKRGIMHTLKIVAPAIGNYDFDLVRMVQEQLLPYPVVVASPLTEDSYTAINPNELEDALKSVFNNKKTIATIQSLILQSK